MLGGQACGLWCGLLRDGGYCRLQVACEGGCGRIEGGEEADCCELHCVYV